MAAITEYASLRWMKKMTDEQEKLEKMKKLYAEKYEQVLKDAYAEALLYGTGPLADVLGMNRTGMYGKGIVEELLEQHRGVKMTDIVEQLREPLGSSDSNFNYAYYNRMCQEAADEIERLREENKRLREAKWVSKGILWEEE